MSENKPIRPVSGIEVGLNHIKRAREGQKLVAEGKPLTEIKTPIIGSTNQEVVDNRMDYLDGIKRMSDDQLANHQASLMQTLETHLNHNLKGTSEYEWRRIQIETEKERRKEKIK